MTGPPWWETAPHLYHHGLSTLTEGEKLETGGSLKQVSATSTTGNANHFSKAFQGKRHKHRGPSLRISKQGCPKGPIEEET